MLNIKQNLGLLSNSCLLIECEDIYTFYELAKNNDIMCHFIGSEFISKDIKLTAQLLKDFFDPSDPNAFLFLNYDFIQTFLSQEKIINLIKLAIKSEKYLILLTTKQNEISSENFPKTDFITDKQFFNRLESAHQVENLKQILSLINI